MKLQIGGLALICALLVACPDDDDEGQPSDLGTTSDAAADLVSDNGIEDSSQGDDVAVDTTSADQGGEDAFDAGGDDTNVGVDTADAGADVVADDLTDEPDLPVDMGPLPRDLRIPGLTGAVSVSLDSRGILHADCPTDLDCFAVQGYMHAWHRFFQMDLFRRAVRGRISTLVGATALDTDIAQRHFMMAADGTFLEDKIWSGLSLDEQAMLEAYTRGVNAFLEDVREGREGARLSSDYDINIIHGDVIPVWEPEDSVAVMLFMLDDLSNFAETELAIGEVYAALGADLGRDLYNLSPVSASTILGASGDKARRGSWLDPAVSEAITERLRPSLGLLRQARERIAITIDMFGRASDAGSNNWVVAPSQATGDVALMANDPHLTMRNPNIFYMVELDAVTNGTGDYHVAGVSLPGVPMVLVGQNEDIAWGVTTAYYDMVDTYVETLNEAGDGVLFDGGEVDLIVVNHTIEVSGGDAVEVEFPIVPHHGPLIAVDEEAGMGISVRWVGAEDIGDVGAFLALNYATSTAEAELALRDITVANQCFVVADTTGSIGWYPYSQVPNRPWVSLETGSWFPLPGDGTAEWDGFLALDDLPALTDPTAGFIATANNDMNGDHADGDPTDDGGPMLQAIPSIGFRHERIVSLLEATSEHTVETMREIQGDTYSLLGEAIIDDILVIADAADSLTDHATAIVAELRSWDYQCETGLIGIEPDADYDADEGRTASSRGCLVFHAVVVALLDEAFGDELTVTGHDEGTDGIVNALVKSLTLLLTSPESLATGAELWDDVSTEGMTETSEDIVLAALEAAYNDITDELGEDVNDWRWGAVHLLYLLTEPFHSAGFPFLNHGPFAHPGGFYTVDPGAPLAGEEWLTYEHGSAFRVVAEASADGVVSHWSLAGGQNINRGHEHYDDLLEGYLGNELIQMPFTRTEADAAAVETFTFEAPE